MTVNINQFVDVDSTIEDAVVKGPNFGIIAAFVETAIFTGWRTYLADAEGLAEALEDDHDEWSEVYRKLLAFAAPDSGVNLVKFYARANENAQVIKMVPTNFDVGYEYKWQVNGIDCTYVVQDGDVAANVVDGFVAGTVVTGVTDADATTHMTLTATDRSVASVFLRTYGPEIEVQDDSINGGIATDLAAAVLLDSAFYGFVTDGYSKAEIEAAAEWAEGAKRQFWYMTNDADVINAEDDNVGETMMGLGYHYSVGVCTRDMRGQLHCNAMSTLFGSDPGYMTINLKRLSGPLVDNWDTTEYLNITGVNLGVYLLTAAPGGTPVGHTAKIKAASGRFADITRDSDWLESALATAIMTYKLNKPKVPNNNIGRAGIQLTGANVMKLAASGNSPVIEPDWAFLVPDKADQTQEERVQRQLRRVTYEATLTGAIEDSRVRGTLRL